VLCSTLRDGWRTGTRPDQGVEQIGEPLVGISITNLTFRVPTPTRAATAASGSRSCPGGLLAIRRTFLKPPN